MENSRHIKVWNECLQIMKDVIPPKPFDTWIKPIKAVSLEDSTFTIEVPNDFFREYLEEHFIDFIGKALKRKLGDNARLMYKVKIVNDDFGIVTVPQQEHPEIKNKDIPYPQKEGVIINPFIMPGLKQLNIDPQLNPNYTFSNFVEGECNKLGRSAGLSISNSPGKNAFNPLFIYGGPGLGKTHLAHAIGIAIKEKFPDKIVLYVSANRFQTQYMDAVNVKNKLTDFMHFYQLVDVLIIDDVHEFAEKPGTQNAFFHIFNQLHQSGKQLILTSDKAPVDLQGLEQRLLSRFKWGLSAELTAPSYETRKAILIAKSFKDGIELPQDVLEFLATNITGNIREIEGTLNSLLAHAIFNKEKITLNLAQRLIEKIVVVNNVEISLNKIQSTVCEYFGISPESLVSKTRKREISQARQIAMYLGRNLTKKSLASIGSQIGGRDHATVLHACNTVSDLIETDRNFKQYVSDIERQLRPQA